MERNELKLLRDQLLAAMGGGHAHLDVESALKDFPRELRGAKLPGSPHTPWQLLEHMRIAQWDILEFSRDAKHKSPKWPDEYWPKSDAPQNDAEWEETVKSFQRDFSAMKHLVETGDLFARFEHGDGQTLLREVLLIANHNSYHLGQFVLLRKMAERRG
jgi:hypothetical protein